MIIMISSVMTALVVGFVRHSVLAFPLACAPLCACACARLQKGTDPAPVLELLNEQGMAHTEECSPEDIPNR